jgi:hypothetical protein
MSRCAGCLLAAVSLAVAAPAAAADDGAIVDRPVAFKVTNTNTSGVPCESDGADYTVRGHLVAPRSALEGAGSRAVTVYLHGFNVGGFMWHPPGAPQLDHPAALARLGHVSIVVDKLGYDSSEHPHGSRMCLGSSADVTHQLVEKLRSGDYAVTGGRPTTFSRVVLAGHDSGATVADIEAYSYQDIDALVHFTWADQGFTETAITAYAELLPTCASGGEPAEQGPPARDDPAGGPRGYVLFLNDAKIREEQRNTEPKVVDRLMRLWNRNPCGEYALVPEAVQINRQRLPEIRVPVLYGYGEFEFLWTPEGLAEQAELYRGSRDLTTVVIRKAGHFPQFSRVASVFHSTIAGWLRSRRLLSAGALTADGCPAANKTIAGGRGAELLRGTSARDNLIGRDGRDRRSGGAGADCVRGNRGRDRLRGGDGQDFLVGDSGRDRVSGGRGDDRLEGRSGADRLHGGPGRDLVIAGRGRDRITRLPPGIQPPRPHQRRRRRARQRALRLGSRPGPGRRVRPARTLRAGPQGLVDRVTLTGWPTESSRLRRRSPRTSPASGPGRTPRPASCQTAASTSSGRAPS